jgi:hypothetical protein
VSRSQYTRVERPEPCVLEIVSKLAREPWTDRPTCVHPVLGSIGRAVHDHSSKPARKALLPLAPRFIGTAQVGYERSARLVALCVSTALTGVMTEDEGRRLAVAHRTALHLLAGRPEGERPGGLARWWLPVLERLRLGESCYRTFGATEQAAEAVAVVARACGDDRDVRLRQLLRQCLAAVGAPQGARRPGAPSPSWSTSPAPQRLWS